MLRARRGEDVVRWIRGARTEAIARGGTFELQGREARASKRDIRVDGTSERHGAMQGRQLQHRAEPFGRLWWSWRRRDVARAYHCRRARADDRRRARADDPEASPRGRTLHIRSNDARAPQWDIRIDRAGRRNGAMQGRQLQHRAEPVRCLCGSRRRRDLARGDHRSRAGSASGATRAAIRANGCAGTCAASRATSRARPARPARPGSSPGLDIRLASAH
jgi:hypothetical protein